jgi:hypothetical protein
MFEYVLGRLKAIGAFRTGVSKRYSIEDILVEWCALHLRGASSYDVRSIIPVENFKNNNNNNPRRVFVSR